MMSKGSMVHLDDSDHRGDVVSRTANLAPGDDPTWYHPPSFFVLSRWWLWPHQPWHGQPYTANPDLAGCAVS